MKGIQIKNAVVERQRQRTKLLKAILKVYGGMTVAEFNRRFNGRDEGTILRYLKIVEAERAQGVEI